MGSTHSNLLSDVLRVTSGFNALNAERNWNHSLSKVRRPRSRASAHGWATCPRGADGKNRPPNSIVMSSTLATLGRPQKDMPITFSPARKPSAWAPAVLQPIGLALSFRHGAGRSLRRLGAKENPFNVARVPVSRNASGIIGAHFLKAIRTWRRRSPQSQARTNPGDTRGSAAGSTPKPNASAESRPGARAVTAVARRRFWDEMPYRAR
jgi:hypothetical protein